jgi:hypothetical protein
MADSLYKALLAAQKEMPDLQKNAVNPHFKNSYISLDSLMEQVLPVLHKHDLLLLQWPTALDRNTSGDYVQLGTSPALRTKLVHIPTGDSCEDVMPLTLERDNPQGQGSAITYARRYALMSILGLVADEDDDGQAASPRRAASKPKPRKKNESEDMEL